jgi:hypothetical protein
MVRVRAQQRVYYAGKEYAPGDELDVTDMHALQLAAIRKVVRAETVPPQEPEPQAEPQVTSPPDDPPKGRHKRRDLRAEN